MTKALNHSFQTSLRFPFDISRDLLNVPHISSKIKQYQKEAWHFYDVLGVNTKGKAINIQYPD